MTTECAGAGACSLSEDKIYICTCDEDHSNFNASTVCTECSYKFDIDT